VVNNYEYELIHHLFCTINTLLNPFHSSRIKGFNQSDVEQLENAVAVLEKLCFWDFESGEELIGSQTEDKAEPEEVPAEDEDKAELEEVPTEDEDEAEPEEVPAEDEDKAESEEVPTEDEDKAEPEEVPAEDEDKAEPKKFTCPYDFSQYTDCCSDDILNPLSEDEIREFNSFVADHNALLIEHEVQSKDKEEPEEVPAQTEDKFSIYCFYEDGYRVAFPVRDKFYNYGLILHMYSNRFEFSNSELYSSTVLNVFNLDNNIHGDILSICICPTVFDPEYTCYYCPPDIDYDEIPF